MATPLSDEEALLHVAYHISFPPELPQQAPIEDDDRQINHRLVQLTRDAIKQYRKLVPDDFGHWKRMSAMLSKLAQNIVTPFGKRTLAHDMTSMAVGDVLAIQIREQNAAVIIRKWADATTFAIFEAQAPNASVMSTPGKLVRHFPGPTIRVPKATANDAHFIEEIAHFLARMNVDVLKDAQAKTTKAGSKAAGVPDFTDPHYISQLFTGILRGFGKEVESQRVVKRIADEVLWDKTYLPWRRSPIWLIIRVVLQTSVYSADYKHFMVYLHAHLLSLSSQEPDFSNDLLSAMRIKMARRMLKVQDSLPERIIQVAQDASDEADTVMKERWATVQNDIPRFGPLRLDHQRAVDQTLPNSRDYLGKVLQGRPNLDTSTSFKPNHVARLASQEDFSVFANGALTRSFEDHKHLALFDFEDAVYKYLPAWVDKNVDRNSKTPCTIISTCINQYATSAVSYYTQDIADRSIMMLTIMELWMALDRLATSRYALLLDYSPEIPEDILETLLLRSSTHLKRASVIQTYLRRRHADATFGSVFTAEPDDDSLSVRYFAQSATLQALKKEIEEDAKRQQKAKIEELRRLNGEHAQLLSSISRTSCQFRKDASGERYHSTTCTRCIMQKQADGMKIAVHEWPLPEDDLDAQAVVFELQCPGGLNLWRGATCRIVRDLGDSTKEGRAHPQCLLGGYDGLATWLGASSHRITLASATKSFSRSQYSETRIPSTESMVCVNNGLQFKLFDTMSYTWVSGPFLDASFSKYGTFVLPPKSSYTYLQYSLEGTAHTSNEILANQSDCPKDLSLLEHYAFGTLRSGPRLQWMNIVRNLEENVFTFSREEVDMLHTQAAWQIGELAEDGHVREWHVELDDTQFGHLLIRQAFRVLNRIRANWLEAITVHTIVMLVSRLLSSTTDATTYNEGYRFLRDARSVTFTWMEELSAKLQKSELESQIVDFQQRVCEMAVICRSTYDVDEHHLKNLLSNSDDYLVLVSCAVTLHDNLPPKFNQAPRYLQTLICRDRRLAFKALPNLLKKIQQQPTLLDDSISEYWGGYRPGDSGWAALPDPNSRWVTTSTASDSGTRSQEVHINLLEGRLLVNGQPLGRLPREYVGHPTYARLFGQKILDVVPASSPGMIFASRTHIEGNQVSFCLDTTGELIIQALRGRTTFELVPFSKLTDDFPLFFSTDYHHWMDLKTGKMEFRPLATPWVSHKNNWRLHFSVDSTSSMEKPSEVGFISLVDVHSHAFRDIYRQIAPLESSRYLHITRTNSDTPKISVELSRMELSFFLNEDMRLESRNFPGQVIDGVQSSGTLVGLRNQLVLCAKDRIAKTLPQSRAILIPYGTVEFALQGNHTQVAINRGSGRQVPVYRYKIDADLGYLANANASLTSRLFKIYLHALTSHCLPDPLTGRTGTEEALYELSEPATTSFDQIDEEQARLLNRIGALTPKRACYPASLRATQTTSWNNLPSLAQHYAFCTIANSILKRADSLQLFNPLSFKLEPHVTKFDEDLLRRAAYRARMYYPIETVFGVPNVLADVSIGDRDSVWYESKDDAPQGWTEAGQLASWASELAHKRWGKPTHIPFDLVSQFEEWVTVHGPSSNLQLVYSQDWLGVRLSWSWLSLYNLCRRAEVSSNRYAVGICLASAAYSGSIPSRFIPILVAFVATPSFENLAPPIHETYQMSDKYKPTSSRISGFVAAASRHMGITPSKALVRRDGETQHYWKKRQTEDYRLNTTSLQIQLTQLWLDCWPNPPSLPASVYSKWFDVASCIQQVRSYFDSCSRNIDIRNHLRRVEQELSARPATTNLSYSTMPLALPKPKSEESASTCLSSSLTIKGLLENRWQSTLIDVPLRPAIPLSSTQKDPPNTSRLKKLLAEFHKGSSSVLCQRYGADLEKSRMDLSRSRSQVPSEKLPQLTVLEQNRALYKDHLHSNLEMVKAWLGPVTNLESVVSASGIWPRLTPRSILAKLALRSRKDILAEHLFELQKYARAYIEYQRSQRLISLAKDGKHDEFFKELSLANADAGDESNHPDWLLVQIDGNFSARTVQTQVAHEMISPSSAASTVLQLNMGEGKSSVIVPIISAALADTTRLVRVVVLKPLWRQMFHLLVSRLSGLVNRRIYYLPFGRHIRVEESQAKRIRNLYAECMREGGILLVQPEHILSFKLIGIDQLLSSSTPQEIAASTILRETQKWLSNNARDILDESDEILHVRYQLVYTIGEQQPLEGHPDRWTTTQQVLSLAASHIDRLKQTYPDKLKHEGQGAGQFPFIRIMPESDEAVSKLINSIAEDSIAGLIPNLNFGLLPRATQDVALRFLTNRNFPADEVNLLQDLDPSVRSGLLLLRGLLACGIVVFALRDKHYRVDYGLHLSRSLLAVPYRAKDIPSLHAEFGHPDVAIVLTCLSYYNSGLTGTQLDTCFELLYKLDNPALEYEQWVRRNEGTPSNIRQLSGVNLKDREQFTEELVPTFARNSAVVDFFLCSVVFPKEAKQFPYKLSTSGWDLAEIKAHVTTGFSGTNDNRYLLPTSIAQSDPVKQSSTNALVLTYLLQPENNHYLCIGGENGETCSAKEFLHMLVAQEPEIRVLLDVGAQMLELKNDELVKYWLSLRPDIAAAVYFNDSDELVILPQDGTPTSFHSSPFAQQMDKCIVYLDDGHTRGTDLRLPKTTRAAVTLGPKVTKDRLLQGCMRMRRLGFGQSVMFCAPTEVDIQIRKDAGLQRDDRIDTLDVIRWAMFETCKDLEHHISHWAQQGVEYNRRADAQRNFSETTNTETLKLGWMTPEARTLREMYDVSTFDAATSGSFTRIALGIPTLEQRLTSLGVQKLEDSSLDEEQEREVSHEVEREQQIERPLKSQPAPHSIHPDVKRFVQTGSLPPSRLSGVISLFHSLKASGTLQRDAWSSMLLASLDFCKTLVTTDLAQLSEYMRPLNWILSGSDGILLVLSPYEANHFLPEIRNSDVVRLHVFAPRVLSSMLSFSDLHFYSTPSLVNSALPSSPPDLLLQLQLSLFAGQLYFDDYAQYRILCGFLGVFIGTDASREVEDIQIQSDGFVSESDRRILSKRIREYRTCKFATSPIAGVKDLVGYRRKGMEYLRTHLGQMLHARQLTRRDF